MPQSEDLSNAIRGQVNDATEFLNRVLKSVEKQPDISDLAVTFVELRQLSAKLAKLLNKLPQA